MSLNETYYEGNEEIKEISVLGGVDSSLIPEPVSFFNIKHGEIVGIVGPTGSGKSVLISDIEQLAQGDTWSGRKVLINGRQPSPKFRFDPRQKRIAQLSQNMNFLADLTVEEFIKMHAKSRGLPKVNFLVDEVIAIADQLTGEPIKREHNLTILSGGQSRALMVADVARISNSPIVLIDEIENAGIKKHEALKLLSGFGKIVLVVTHDPLLALLTERRVVMKNGGMQMVIDTSSNEKDLVTKLSFVDNQFQGLREKIRTGQGLTLSDFAIA